MSKGHNGKVPATTAHIAVNREEAALLMELINRAGCAASQAKALGSLYDKIMAAGGSLGVQLAPPQPPAPIPPAGN